MSFSVVFDLEVGADQPDSLLGVSFIGMGEALREALEGMNDVPENISDSVSEILPDDVSLIVARTRIARVHLVSMGGDNAK